MVICGMRSGKGVDSSTIITQSVLLATVQVRKSHVSFSEIDKLAVLKLLLT